MHVHGGCATGASRPERAAARGWPCWHRGHGQPRGGAQGACRPGRVQAGLLLGTHSDQDAPAFAALHAALQRACQREGGGGCGCVARGTCALTLLAQGGALEAFDGGETVVRDRDAADSKLLVPREVGEHVAQVGGGGVWVQHVAQVGVGSGVQHGAHVVGTEQPLGARMPHLCAACARVAAR